MYRLSRREGRSSRDVGIGRQDGLKIRWAVMLVWVQVPLAVQNTKREMVPFSFFVVISCISYMSDLEYIEAIRNDNQQAISAFYREYKDNFVRSIRRKYTGLRDDFLSEIYQESILRLWQNIQEGKLTEANLTGTLAGYLYRVGDLVTKEIRRREENFKTVEPNEDLEKQLANISYTSEDSDNGMFRAIRNVVNNMGTPCAPLLLKFYWEKHSLETIAEELGYKDANSAKTQKYKCMRKLKVQILKHKNDD